MMWEATLRSVWTHQPKWPTCELLFSLILPRMGQGRGRWLGFRGADRMRKKAPPLTHWLGLAQAAATVLPTPKGPGQYRGVSMSVPPPVAASTAAGTRWVCSAQ